MKLYKTKDASKFCKEKRRLDISPSTFAKRRAKGLPPRFIRLNGACLYRDVDLLHWIDSQRYVNDLKKTHDGLELSDEDI